MTHTRRTARTLALALVCAAWVGLWATAAHAATINVNSTAQEATQANPNGIVNGNCTLGEAILAANTNAMVDACTAGEPAMTATDTIMMPAGTYLFTDKHHGATFFELGLPNADEAVIVQGAGADQTILEHSATAAISFAVIATNAPTTIQGLTIRGFPGNATTTFDGALFVAGGSLNLSNVIVENGVAAAGQPTGVTNSRASLCTPITIDNSLFQNNTSDFAEGAALRACGTITISNSTFLNNSTTSGNGGGAVFFQGAGGGSGGPATVTISNTLFSGNTSAGSGGAIRAESSGTMNISNSLFLGNSVPQSNPDGGAIHNIAIATTITDSTFLNNSARHGGAIESGSPLTVRNSTFSGNSTCCNGGAIRVNVPADFENVTIVGNSTPSGSGGGIFLEAASANIRNSIVAGNSPGNFGSPFGGGPGFHEFFSQGHNVLGETDGVFFNVGTGDQIGTPQSPLDPRARGFVDANSTTVLAGSNVGGQSPIPVLTRALLSNSPAVDAGDPGTPDGVSPHCPPTDQRGVARPVGATCDVGAFEGASPYMPAISPGGVVNAASFAPGLGLAPGSIVALFGDEESLTTAIVGSIPLDTTLGGASVTLDDGMAPGPLAQFPGPLFFASRFQINFQLPWELQGGLQAGVSVSVQGGGTSPAEMFPLAGFAPGLFAVNQQGTGQGAILIANSATVAAPPGSIPGATSQRATHGVDFLEIYCTGLGPVTNQPASGAAASANPLSETMTMPTVTIGGVDAPVLFSGLAPNFVGLYVVTLQVPANAPTGDAVPVVLTIGGINSNTVTIAVQ